MYYLEVQYRDRQSLTEYEFETLEAADDFYCTLDDTHTSSACLYDEQGGIVWESN